MVEPSELWASDAGRGSAVGPPDVAAGESSEGNPIRSGFVEASGAPWLPATDLMGYGRPQLGPPVLSACDLKALEAVFAWAHEGVEPYPSTAAAVDC